MGGYYICRTHGASGLSMVSPNVQAAAEEGKPLDPATVHVKTIDYGIDLFVDHHIVDDEFLQKFGLDAGSVLMLDENNKHHMDVVDGLVPICGGCLLDYVKANCLYTSTWSFLYDKWDSTRPTKPPTDVP